MQLGVQDHVILIIMIIYPIVAVSPLLRFQQVLESVFRLSSS